MTYITESLEITRISPIQAAQAAILLRAAHMLLAKKTAPFIVWEKITLVQTEPIARMTSIVTRVINFVKTKKTVITHGLLHYFTTTVTVPLTGISIGR